MTKAYKDLHYNRTKNIRVWGDLVDKASPTKFTNLDIMNELVGIKRDVSEAKDRLGKVENRLGKVENRLGKVENRLGKVEKDVAENKKNIAKINGRLNTIVTKNELRE